jgi:hypothetical protein
MTETTKRARGGRAFHSILAPHFEFIRQLRKQRKTWKEIAEHLHREKGIRVTLYAPYFFCKRRLKRMTRPHWENEAISKALPKEVQPVHSKKPVLPAADFCRPDRTTFNPDDYL